MLGLLTVPIQAALLVLISDKDHKDASFAFLRASFDAGPAVFVFVCVFLLLLGLVVYRQLVMKLDFVEIGNYADYGGATPRYQRFLHCLG